MFYEIYSYIFYYCSEHVTSSVECGFCGGSEPRCKAR